MKDPEATTDRRARQRALRQAIAAGDLRAALDRLLTYTEGHPLHDEAVMLAGKLTEYERDARQGTESYDDLSRTQARISEALLELVAELPATGADGKPAPPAGIAEGRLKMHLLFILFVAKALVVGRLFTEWEAGGYSTEQFIATLSLLVPVFATYTGIMFKEVVRSRHLGRRAADTVRVRRSFQWTAYAVCLAYFLAIWTLIGMKPQGTLAYGQMTGLLATVESGLGVYVGHIVFALFRREAA